MRNEMLYIYKEKEVKRRQQRHNSNSDKNKWMKIEFFFFLFIFIFFGEGAVGFLNYRGTLIVSPLVFIYLKNVVKLCWPSPHVRRLTSVLLMKIEKWKHKWTKFTVSNLLSELNGFVWNKIFEFKIYNKLK